jgi:transcriptional regulator GlxA family with amidase domain
MNAPIDINENCLTVAEVAERLKVNEETVRRLFLNELGVIVICFPRRGKRVYRTLRIPESVFLRVLTRFTKVD